MAGQNLTTNIIINAKAGNGFSKIGNTLTELGSMVNGISQELISFGKDSVKIYRDYEKSMKDAEVALSTTYGRGTQQLAKVMAQLDASATEWAATTIFHTNDVANAISEAAHAGWDLDQMMSGLPAAMQLAQAGGLDLSEAVNYIVKSTSAAGVGFENLGEFIDLWAFAANSSASTIGEFGDAMLRMGSTMRFTGNTEELMTLIAMTANAGSVGSEAGTMIRNSIMRLIAPTDKANKAITQLGATTEETADLMENEALAAANAELAARGFSAFDGEGNLKNVLDIYRELYLALGEIAGGFENIDRNEDALTILSAIFPTRTITEALTLLRAASTEYDGLYEAMMGGSAQGYGEYAAETMMASLDGRIETFNSKVERLKQIVGAELKGQVEDAAAWAGNLVDSLAEMDPDVFSALVSGLEVVAAAGPGLLMAGGAFRLLGLIATPLGGLTTALIAFTAAAVAIKDLQDSKFADNFGSMELDTVEIQEHLRELGNRFRETYAEADAFRDAMNQAASDYESASSALSGSLLTNMLTGAKLTGADKEELSKLGSDMYAAVQDTIANSAAGEMSYWQAFFGGDGQAEANGAYQEVIGLANAAYEEAMAEATEISRGLQKALTSAFADGKISQEEYQNILSYMRSYNDAIARAEAEAESEQAYIEREKLLRKAQTASFEQISGISQEMAEQRDALLEETDDKFWTNYYKAKNRGASTETLEVMARQHEEEMAAARAPYDQGLLGLWDSQIRQSEQGENFEWLSELAGSWLEGGLTTGAALDLITGTLGKSVYAGQKGWGAKTSDRAELGRMLGLWVNAMGGESAIEEMIAAGDSETANLYAMEQLVNGFHSIYQASENDILTSAQVQGGHRQDNRAAAEAALFRDSGSDYSVEIARRAVEALGEASDLGLFFETIGEAAAGSGDEASALWGTAKAMLDLQEGNFQNLMQRLADTYDFSAVLADYAGEAPSTTLGNELSSSYAAWQLLYGEASANAEAYRFQAQLMPYAGGMDAVEALQGQGVEVMVSGDATELTATIDGADGLTLLEYLDGDATELSMRIMEQDGRTLIEYVTGDVSELERVLAQYQGRTIRVNITGMQMFAEGGRATTASIFGEAGPEWAIPEEHSERTAALLNAARAASGFTWPDILARFGGLNANPNHTPASFVYAPVIHAADARGVDTALREDKKRLDKWYEEKKMRDGMEVYA